MKLKYIKFGLDILMAITFVLFFNTRVFGGLTFHEIAGLAIGVAFFTHILLNWKWVKKVTLRIFDRKLPIKIKFGYLLNLLLLISMAFIIISGVIISRVIFPNMNIGNERWFQTAHISVSFLVLVLVAAHVGLHWKWVMNVFKGVVKVKRKNPILGITLKIVTALILVFGIYQIYSTNFLSHLKSVGNVFNLTAYETAEAGHYREGRVGEESFKRHERVEAFSEGEGNFSGSTPPKEFKREGEGGFGNVSPLEVITTYSGIMAVFIIPIYYLEKMLFKRKRKKKNESHDEILS